MVVIVEDDSAMRQALERMLTAAGLGTDSYVCGEDLLARDPAPRPDCLVIDVCLPGISGFHLQKRLTRRGSRAPVIFISAHDSPGIRHKAAEFDAAGFLPKPFMGQTLLSTIRRALGGDG